MSFSGVALYDIFGEVGDDVSQIVSMISPSKTPFLDFVGMDPYPVTSKKIFWDHKSLLPESYLTSSAIASSALESYGVEIGANARLLRVGDILRNPNNNEQMYVNSIGASAATIYVQRAYAGTSATSLEAGSKLVFVASAIAEGAGPRNSRRRGKTELSNYVQTFREDINISNLSNNALMRYQMKGQNIVEPYNEELVDKTRECLIQLERAVLMGRTNSYTIGADDVPSTMAGIYFSVAPTNIVSHATFSNSILNEAINTIENYADVRGDIDQYFLLCGNTAVRKISNVREARINQDMASTEAGLKAPRVFESDFGPMPIMHSRHLPNGSILILRKDFVKVRGFAGNSFRHRQYEDGTSSKKGYVEGTYTLELHQLESHARLDGLA